MSSFGARKTVRTYSRHKKRSLYDEEPPTKRRRVDDILDGLQTAAGASILLSPPPKLSITPSDNSAPPSSSPKASPVLLPDEQLPSTPPSSPAQPEPSPLRQRRRPLFSFLKRYSSSKHPAKKEPLSERSNNVPSPPKQPPKKKRLVQMQLDLVAELTRMCKVCGMEYIPSHAEDAALHRRFHTMNVGGIDMTRALVEKLKQNQVWSGGDRSFIAVVSRRDTLAMRNKTSEVLKVVNTELGAVPIPDDILWSQVRNPIAGNVQTRGTGAQQAPKTGLEHSASDRFKAYLYIQGGKCVGACLTERIHEAFPVQGQDDASELTGRHPAGSHSSSISIGESPEPAILGVSRIWTSNSHRKHGIATRLLDSARSDFLYGMTIEKAKVAFSQPTESGGQLARKWFGRRAGWHVYID